MTHSDKPEAPAHAEAAGPTLYLDAVAGRYPAFTWPLLMWPDDIEHFDTAAKRAPHLGNPSDPNRIRLHADRAIVRRALADLIQAGWACSIDYGDGQHGEAGWSRDLCDLMCDIQACDEETIRVKRPRGEKSEGFETGWVSLIYNNGIGSPVSDYTTNLEEVLKATSDLQDEVDEAILRSEGAIK